jgi:DNA-binding transcriptional ArsR family regulator
MIEAILGNATAEKVLLYLEQFGEGYALRIAKDFDGMAVTPVQRQLERFEAAGLLASQLKGRTRLYTWNPRYPFLDETRALLRKVLKALPEDERRRYFASQRRRPRRTGKPL